MDHADCDFTAFFAVFVPRSGTKTAFILSPAPSEVVKKFNKSEMRTEKWLGGTL